MEFLHQGYEDVMVMPVGRRRRLIEEREHIVAMAKAKNKNKGKRGKW